MASAGEEVGRAHLEKIIEPPQLDLPNVALTDQLLFEFLLGDVAWQRGRPELAAQAYLDLAKTTRDPRVARRAAQLTYEAHEFDQSVEAFQLWQQLEPASPLAKQMLVSILLSGGKLQEALPHATVILESDPQNRARSFLNFHSQLARIANPQAALDWILEVTHPYQDIAEGHWVVAQSAQAADKYELALSEARQAVVLKPDWDGAVVLEAQLTQKTNPQQGANLLKKFLESHDDRKEVRLFYARMLLEQKQYAASREEFGKLLQQRPDSPELAFAIAMISLQLGELDRAEQELRQALAGNDKNQDNDTLHYYLGQLGEAKKDDVGALQEYRLVKGGENAYTARLRVAYLLNKQGHLEEARKFIKSTQTKGQSQQIQIVMIEAQFLREANQHEESFKVLAQGLVKFPNNPELIYQSALTADKLNKLDTFEKLMRKLIEIEPNNAHAYNALGYSFLERNIRVSEGMNLVSKAYKIAPNDAAIIDSMGWGYFRLGEYEHSVEFLRKAYKINTDPEISAHLGEALWMSGNKEEAQKLIDDSLLAHPSSDALKATLKRLKP